MDKKSKTGKKKRVLLAGIAVSVLLVAAAGIFFFVRNAGNRQRSKGKMPQDMDFMGENVVSASGLTSVAMQEETLKLDFLETELYVEESFLSAGDEVKEGTAVFRISEDTLAKAKSELQNAVTEAELAYKQGVLDHETNMAAAKTSYETASVNEKYAKTVYDNSLKEASAQLKKLEEQVETARELAEEYERSVNEDYYRTYYKVDELYQAYADHCALLINFYKTWDVERLEDLYGNLTGNSDTGVNSSGSNNHVEISANSLNSDNSAGGGGGSPDSNKSAGGGGSSPDSNSSNAEGGRSSASNEEQQKLTVYNLLDDLVTQESQAYEAALNQYEEAKERAAAGLSKAQSDLAELEAELTVAKSNYEKQKISCKADYETTLAESQNAGVVYETTVQSLEETLGKLEDDRDEAKENQELFEQYLGDGTFYTKKAGTIVMNAVRENSRLAGDTMVIAYSDPETVTISANVDQSSIASVSIGESVYAVVSEYGNYHGTVTSISPVTRAQSRSSVTYQVTVTLDGDVENLESNLTAYVYFGLTEEMMQQMEQREETAPENGMRQTEDGDGKGVPEHNGGEGEKGMTENPTRQKGEKREKPAEE